MKNIYFILHGSFGSPLENWFPWLQSALCEKGDRCYTPAFPTPDDQTFDNWASILDSYKKIGLLDRRTTLIAHSSACVFAVKYALSRSIQCKQLVTVAGFNGFVSGETNFDKINSEFYITSNELGKAKKHFEIIDCFFSSSDPYLPLPTLQDFAREAGGAIHQVDKAGHFNTKSGYKSFDAIIPILK